MNTSISTPVPHQQALAKQMFVARQPNVYIASSVPADIAGDPNDARAKLIRYQVAAGTTPTPLQSDNVHTVVDMKGIDLSALGIHIAWPESDDHAKLCISDRSEQVHFVCIGDMNFTIAQRKRGGGTTAFHCEPLWESISGILHDVAPFPHVRGRRRGG